MNLSQNKYWTWTFLVLTTNVYFLTECLQISNLIAPKDHLNTTIYSYVYNWLYVLLLQVGILKMSNIVSPKYPNIILYSFFYLLGSFGFALLGEVPSLKSIVIVPGFWNRLNWNAKVTIIGFTIVFFVFGIIQLYYSIKDQTLCTHFLAYLAFLLFYGSMLTILIYAKTPEIMIHVHHAICSSLISFWFVDWTAKSSMIIHAILMGVVTEGIDFFGIGELSLFMLGSSSKVTFTTSLVIGLVTTFFSALSVYFIEIKRHLNILDYKNKRLLEIDDDSDTI